MNDEQKAEQALGRVRKLLERADHPNTPEAEADACRARAEALMLKYRLDEAMGVMAGTSTVTPVWRKLDLCLASSEYSRFYHNLARTVMNHIGARGEVSWRETPEGYWSTLEWVGYSSDLNYGDLLLTACMMEFGKRLEPKYDPSQSDRDNIYNMRSAGMERKRIALLVYGEWSTENEMKAKNRRVTAEFKRACEERGEDWGPLLGRGVNVAGYREDYANGFVQTFSHRLRRLRAVRGEEGTGLVLADRQDKVDEAYYLKHPNRRPSNEPSAPWVDPSKDCPKCQKAKSGYCRDHAWLRPSTAQPRGRMTNSNAYSRGGAAAALVDLGANSAGRGRATAADRKALG